MPQLQFHEKQKTKMLNKFKNMREVINVLKSHITNMEKCIKQTKADENGLHKIDSNDAPFFLHLSDSLTNLSIIKTAFKEMEIISETKKDFTNNDLYLRSVIFAEFLQICLLKDNEQKILLHEQLDLLGFKIAIHIIVTEDNNKKILKFNIYTKDIDIPTKIELTNTNSEDEYKKEVKEAIFKTIKSLKNDPGKDLNNITPDEILLTSNDLLFQKLFKTSELAEFLNNNKE